MTLIERLYKSHDAETLCADAARAIESLQAENERLKADYLKIESLCDETYVAQGADAYNHACDEMERFQKQRRKAGKEVGTERSLCDGMGWLYRHVAEVEAERDALAAKLVSLEADAERYRWWCTPGNDIWSDDTVNKETIDAAIDASIDAAKGGQHEDA